MEQLSDPPATAGGTDRNTHFTHYQPALREALPGAIMAPAGKPTYSNQ
jgi:hypothetical protein